MAGNNSICSRLSSALFYLACETFSDENCNSTTESRTFLLSDRSCNIQELCHHGCNYVHAQPERSEPNAAVLTRDSKRNQYRMQTAQPQPDCCCQCCALPDVAIWRCAGGLKYVSDFALAKKRNSFRKVIALSFLSFCFAVSENSASWVHLVITINHIHDVDFCRSVGRSN